MIKVKQTILHDPAKGKIGNCFAAFLASVLELPIDTIPHFVADTKDDPDDSAWIKALNKWLKPHNLCFITIGADAEWLADIGVDGLYHDLAGRSPRNKDNFHATVGLDGILIHDTHPDNTGTVGDECLGVFVVLEPWRLAGFKDTPKEVTA